VDGRGKPGHMLFGVMRDVFARISLSENRFALFGLMRPNPPLILKF
jgi:hypothetical protein